MAPSPKPPARQTARYRYDDVGTLLVRQGPGGSTDTQYYLRDGLGSIVALTDTTGALVANYTYDPYGKTLSATGTKAADNPWRYASGYTDQTTGLTKFGTRYYSPDLGRWTQLDPSGQNYGYSYAGSNPINATDRSGRLLDELWPDDLGDFGSAVSEVAGIAGAAADLAWFCYSGCLSDCNRLERREWSRFAGQRRR